MITINNLSKIYNDGTGIRNISLVFPHAGLYFIEGKSGCGKTTLLNVLGLFDSYDSGEYFIDSTNIGLLSSSEMNRYRNEIIGYIYQDYRLFDELTVAENITIKDSTIDEEKLNNILEKLELTDFKNKESKLLSGGQKQRVAIARTLYNDCKIILADEPTGNLDSKTSKQIMDIFKDLSKSVLIIIVSHDHEIVTKYADHITYLKDGQVIKEEKINECDISSNKKIDISSKQTGSFNKKIRKALGIKKRNYIILGITQVLLFAALGTAFSLMASNCINTLINEVTSNQNYKYTSILDYNNRLPEVGYTYENICSNLNAYSGISYVPDNGGHETSVLTLYDDINFEQYSLSMGTYPMNANDIVISDYIYEKYHHPTSLSDGAITYNVTGVYLTDYNSVKNDDEYFEYISNCYYNISLCGKKPAQNTTSFITSAYFYEGNQLINQPTIEHKSINNLTSSLLYGTLPTKNNEIVVDEILATYFTSSVENIVGTKFTYDNYCDLYQYYANDYTPLYTIENMTIVGVCEITSYGKRAVYMMHEDFTKCCDFYNKYFDISNFVCQPTRDNLKTLKKLGAQINIYNSDDIYKFYNITDIAKYVIFGVGIVFLTIDLLLIYKDIISLLTEKKNYIGTLLGIGISKKDVKLNILLKYLILFIVCALLSVPLIFVFITLGQNTIVKMLPLLPKVLTFPYWQLGLSVVLLLGVGALIVMISFKKINRNNICYWLKNN